jgi:UDP-N-acetylmuramoylalanine--D-glutamate ligase
LAHTRFGDDYLAELTEDVIFRSPGMRPDLPEFAAAVKRGATLTSEMEAFFELCPCPIIAVTGSDGKTTTTTLIAELLKESGKTVHLGGNIGRPLLADIDKITPTDFAVVELSSFQLMTMKRSPHVAVVTNVAPNHLDWHKNFDEYVQAKTNIFTHQTKDNVLVVNMDNEITRQFGDGAIGTVRVFSAANADTLPPMKLRGDHNKLNMLAAIQATKDWVTAADIKRVASKFAGVEHRLEFVRELNGVTYINDSIATSPDRTIAGIKSFEEPIILIAGGKDKGIPFDALGAVIRERINILIVTGPTGDKIEAAAGKPNMTVHCPDLEAAVYMAQKMSEPGDVVLLSPASTSFDAFKNFEERGNLFKEVVNKLI